MSQLLNEVENFVLRMAAEFPQRREQLVFLINNYDMMLAVIVVRWLVPLILTYAAAGPDVHFAFAS